MRRNRFSRAYADSSSECAVRPHTQAPQTAEVMRYATAQTRVKKIARRPPRPSANIEVMRRFLVFVCVWSMFCSVFIRRREGKHWANLPPPVLAWCELFCLYCLNNAKFGQLILSKIVQTVSITCEILRRKCIRYDFGWYSASDPAETADSAPQTPGGGPTAKGGGSRRDKSATELCGHRFITFNSDR